MNKFGIEDIRQTFRGKNIFITGHTGFKGSWLSYILDYAGATVTGFSLPPSSKKNHFNYLELDKKIINIIGDIRNFQLLNKSISEAKPDFIFHLAAQALVRKSYNDTLETYQTNVIGSTNLLESVRLSDTVRSLIFITSDKCYENIEKDSGYDESSKLGGIDPYSASKASAELIYSSYCRSFYKNKKNFGSASVRAGNVIGGGDWSNDRIIPDCVRSIEKDEPIIIRNPNSTRPWQHVLEPISGYLLLAKEIFLDPNKYNGSWNFGPDENQNKTVLEVVKSFQDKIGKGSHEVKSDKDQLYESKLLQLNCDKAKKYLGWSPRWDFKKTIDATAEWYKFIMTNKNAEEITLTQIKEYFN